MTVHNQKVRPSRKASTLAKYEFIKKVAKKLGNKIFKKWKDVKKKKSNIYVTVRGRQRKELKIFQYTQVRGKTKRS